MTTLPARPRVFNTATTSAAAPAGERLRTARPRAALREGRTDWYRIQNFVDQPDTAAIYIYDEIGYWGTSAQDFVRDLQQLKVANLDVHINSPGGDVFDGVAIYNALRTHQATVTVHIDALAASAASFIAMAGNKVIIARNAQMMIHDASGVAIGDAAIMREMAELLDKCSDNIADIYTQKAGGTVKAWRSAMTTETWYSADEALTAGLVDEIDGADAPQMEPVAPAAAANWDLTVFAYAGRANAPAPMLPTATAQDTAPATEDDDEDEQEGVADEPPAPAVAEPVVAEPLVDPAEDSESTDTDNGPAEQADTDQIDTEWAAVTSGLHTDPADAYADAVFNALKGVLL